MPGARASLVRTWKSPGVSPAWSVPKGQAELGRGRSGNPTATNVSAGLVGAMSQPKLTADGDAVGGHLADHIANAIRSRVTLHVAPQARANVGELPDVDLLRKQGQSKALAVIEWLKRPIWPTLPSHVRPVPSHARTSFLKDCMNVASPTCAAPNATIEIFKSGCTWPR